MQADLRCRADVNVPLRSDYGQPGRTRWARAQSRRLPAFSKDPAHVVANSVDETRNGTRRVSRWRLVPRAPSSCRFAAPRCAMRGASNPARWGTLHSVLLLHGSKPGAALSDGSGFLLLAMRSTDGERSSGRHRNACRPFVLRGTSGHEGRGATGGMPLPPARASEEPRRHGRVVRI
jgi:hypothetical protein